jgi:hypothetical protein
LREGNREERGDGGRGLREIKGQLSASLGKKDRADGELAGH